MALVKPLGGYMTRVFNGERTLSPGSSPSRAALYRIAQVDEKREQDWLTYTVAMLLFHVGGFVILYALCAAGCLPLQSGRSIRGAGRSQLQHGGELHHQHQLAELRRREHALLPRADAGLTHQNFLSAATGIVWRLPSSAASRARP